LEALDLVGGHRAEVIVEALAALELLAVDQEGVRSRQRVAVLVEVAEEREASVLQCRRAVLVLAVEARNVVVDELGGRGVVADDDEAGRYGDLLLLPQSERLIVVSVERLYRVLPARRLLERL